MMKSYRDKLKASAHRLVKMAILEGHLIDLTKIETACVDCGTRATDWDHRDLAKPIEVVPVCHRCNLQRGPALPIITAADELEYKLNWLGEKSSGNYWSGILGGEGWTPLEVVCHIAIEPEAAIGDDNLGGEDRYSVHICLYANKTRKLRDDYFKMHDPWFEAEEI